MYPISVVVTTYNQSYADISRTLNSIVNQDFDDFEIIVADDCSKENPKEALERYFAEVGFPHYRIIVNPTNVGTVRNILGALEIAAGDYVKVLGAGDMLYAYDTLQQIDAFSRAHDIHLAFGKLKTYSAEGGTPLIRSFNAPTKPEMYVFPQNREAIFEQQLVWGDWIPAGSLFFKRDYIKDYFSLLATDYQVRYCEDFVSTLVSLTDTIDFFDEYLYWYEWGVGVSNSGSSAARKRMYADHTNLYSGLKQRYAGNKTVAKAYRLFTIKRFLMLHTPLARLLTAYKSAQYLRAPKNQNENATGGEDFLLMNLDSPHVMKEA